MKNIRTVMHISDEMAGGGAESVFRDTMKASQENGDVIDYFISDKKRNFLSYIFSFKNYKKLYKKLNIFRPDVIHLHNYYHYLTPSILLAIRNYKKHKHCKVIFTAHDYHLICPNSGFQYFENDKAFNFSPDGTDRFIVHKLDRRSWTHSCLKIMQNFISYKLLKLDNVFDLILCPSNFLKETLLNYGVKTKCLVVRNPFNIEEKKMEVPTNKKDGAINLVFFGRLSPEKGIMELIENINKRTTIDINLNLYGNGILKDEIIASYKRSGFKIIINDFLERSELHKKIKVFDIFVLPGVWYENAPNSIIEAASMGLPVMVSNIGGMVEMAKETSEYYLLDPKNNDLEELIINASSKKGLNKVKNPMQFSYNTYKNKIASLYGDSNSVD